MASTWPLTSGWPSLGQVTEDYNTLILDGVDEEEEIMTRQKD